MLLSKSWNYCVNTYCFMLQWCYIIQCIPAQNTTINTLRAEVWARGSLVLFFYSLLTPHWLYECQLSPLLWHSPHPLVRLPSSHQQRQNKGRPTCYYHWMKGINHSIPSCHQWQVEKRREKFGDGKTNNPWYSRMAAPSDKLCACVCVCMCMCVHMHT